MRIVAQTADERLILLDCDYGMGRVLDGRQRLLGPPAPLVDLRAAHEFFAYIGPQNVAARLRDADEVAAL